MKYLTISTLAPGVDVARGALEVFKKIGLPPGTESAWASANGKTFITVTESDGAPDMASTSTFAPYLAESHVIPIVAIDDDWMKAIEAAQANWA
jgi:hypothetical protein